MGLAAGYMALANIAIGKDYPLHVDLSALVLAFHIGKLGNCNKVDVRYLML
jgi:hypothetical protein